MESLLSNQVFVLALYAWGIAIVFGMGWAGHMMFDGIKIHVTLNDEREPRPDQDFVRDQLLKLLSDATVITPQRRARGSAR